MIAFPTADPLDRVRVAAEARLLADLELRNAIRAAADSGITLRVIAEAAGLSAEGVRKIVRTYTR